MKSIKILSILAFVFAVAIFQSCEVDKCDAVICLNDGTCDEGVCACPTGYSGTLCESHCSTDISGTYTPTPAGSSDGCAAQSYVITRTSDTRAEVAYNNSIHPGLVFTGTINADCTLITLDATGAFPDSNNFVGISEGSVTITGNDIAVYLLANAGDSCTGSASK